ncbi:MAG: hypothetical protein V1827_02055 [Candidatus Micrarchaeota archaeon]
MRKLFFIALIALGALSFSANQTEVCKAQCSAYELVWMDDYCFSYIQEMCAKDPTDVGLDMIGFWADMVLKDISLQTYMEAYICVDMVEQCVVPVNNACMAYCRTNNQGYAPNPHLDDDSIYYSEKDKKLHIRVENTGLAYIDRVYVKTETGSSDTYGVVPKLTQKDARTLEGLRPHYVRWSPEDMVWDRTFTVDYQPTVDKYNVVRVSVSTDPWAVESTTADNSVDFIINDLPNPAFLQLERANATRVEPSTTMFLIKTAVKNTGEVSGDATLKYYLGSAYNNTPFAQTQVSVAGNGTASDEQYYEFTSPRKTSITIELVKDGQVIGTRTLFLEPQFLLVRGTVTDDIENPLEKAWIETRHESNFFTGPTINLITGTDEKGDYEFYLYLTEEGPYPISASKQGYFGNSTTFNYVYNDSDRYFFDTEKIVDIDFTLTQHPLELNPANYPEDAMYIVETDRDRFAGEYVYGAGNIPIRGGNGTLFITSKRCSPYASDFLTRMNGSDMAVSDVKCLNADSVDDYTVLDKEVKLWEKTYDGEEPRMAFFDKRGDHAYVLTANNDNNFCNVYGYDLVTGNQQFRFTSNSNCIQRSMVVPAYDGESVYIGMNAVKYAKAGDTRAKGYRLSETGVILDEWQFPENTESLERSSATEYLDIVEDFEFYLTDNRTIEDCMLTPGHTCDPPGGKYSIEYLGISKNRVLGKCNNTLCLFTLAYNDYTPLEGGYMNHEGDGNYANDDVFVFYYDGGRYYSDGDREWEVKADLDDASMSPGGSFIAVAYDPYAIEIFNADGENLTKTKHHATGLEATERGIFFATHQGPKIEFYRLSTMVEPGSSTTTTQNQGNTSFVAQFFQVLSDAYNAVVDWLKGLFGL